MPTTRGPFSIASPRSAATHCAGEHEDSDGMAIEPFALCDNLMLTGTVTHGSLATASVTPAERYTSL